MAADVEYIITYLNFGMEYEWLLTDVTLSLMSRM